MKTSLEFKSDKINITPDFPCRLTGMSDEQRSEGVFSDLEVNTMIFKCEEKIVYIISIDTLFISDELKVAISDLINTEFGQTNEVDIICLSTHTHYAPSLEKKRVKLGAKDDKYYSYLLLRLESLFKKIKNKSFTEVELKYSDKTSQGITCNRRRKVRLIRNYFRSFIAMEPNPNGFIDERFKILNIYNSSSQKVIATIWSFPCHPTNFPNKTFISSEFPGDIRKSIRSENDSNDSIIYLPGFAGDVRAIPPKRKSLSKLIRTVFQLSFRVSDYRFINLTEYSFWKDSLVKAFKESNTNQYVLNHDDAILTSKTSEEPLKNIGLDVEDIESIKFRKIKIGQDFAIYTISAEPVGNYSKIFDANIKDKFAICTGYADNVFGYLPIQNQIDEGGYESGGYFDIFLVKGKFNKTIEPTVISNIRKLNNVQ